MTYCAPNYAAAIRAAAHLNETMPDENTYVAAGRPTTRYIVEKYAHPDGQYGNNRTEGRFEYGVVRRWKYADRPDLSEFGGAFHNLSPADLS